MEAIKCPWGPAYHLIEVGSSSAIDDSRRSHKELCVGWLDLTNAFGSVPHRHIFNTLERMGMSPHITSSSETCITEQRLEPGPRADSLSPFTLGPE